MKLNEIVPYKDMGTIQMIRNEDGEKKYIYTHKFFNEGFEEDTLKGAKEMLEYDDRKAQEIRGAIYTLKLRGYKVYKELA
jgi:hypothetical protein